MSDEVFSTTLAYTESPRVAKRTTFQDELIRAITARSARQRSSEYSDDFDSDEIVSLGDFSDTSIDENSVKKKVNDFHLSDDEEKNYSRPSFLKTMKSNSDITKDEPVCAISNDEEKASDGCEDMVVNSLSDSPNKDQEAEKEKIKMKPKPRILSIQSASSAENSSSFEIVDHFKPSPRPRSMLKKNSHREEKDRPGEDKEAALSEEFKESHSAPVSPPTLNGRQLEAEKRELPKNLDLENSCLTSPPSLKGSLGDSFSPGTEGKVSIKDENEEFTENHNSLKSDENEENSFSVDFIITALEKSKESQVTTGDLEEEKEKAELIMEDDITIDPLLSKSQGILIPTNATESAKKAIEDRNTKNKKSPNNRVSSASSRLMTSEFLKKSNSKRRSPSSTTSSHYLGTLKVLDQKPSQKPSIEPDKADNIRAAVYQEWLEKKNVYLHEMHRIKRIESENLRIQNEQKIAAKREEALASFEAWKAMKEKEARKMAAKKRLEEKNKKKTEEENAVRKRDALQAFEKWKEKKMEYLKEKNKKEKEYERAKKQKEEETVAEKKKDNLTAVEKWNEKKEAFFKQKEKEKINEKRKEELKRAEKKDKDKQAINEYEKWLENKERQERIERKQKKRHSFLENEALPPWSPPSRTVFSKVF
ncbi:microtubule-associated protein 9 [Carlito syrichta]|uniref:Microtubule-associated protein 9 n=1 Tax=Carlito syrichta TaxID=1868482 RepID=A0A1U7T7A7_CARSF|nr:microtubule-associated protein 9 [Carlito syrichta]XP_008049739.1 microtubule-associated protein 9 [Carlito syrichta]XP_008049740.1 microtubule-associated protein 9 [Carlito syrichta]XP_008049741.1 microtubule-associated protein 9 [Carlito syrichta]